MKSILRLISSFGILILILLVPSVGRSNPNDIPHSVLTNQASTVLSIAFNPKKSNILACGLSDGRIQVWDTSTHTLLYIIYYDKDLIFSLAFSPDGSVLASGSADGNVRLWNVGTEKLRHKLSEHTDLVTCLAFSADGKTLASGSGNGTIRLWNPDTGEQKNVLQGYEVPVSSLAFSPTENTLVTGRADNIIRVWDLATGTLRHILLGHEGPVISLAFSLDGSTLASGSADSTVRLWDMTKDKTVKTLTAHTILTEHTDWVNSVAFNRTTLASGSHDKTIRLWDANTGKLQHTLTEHTGSVESLAFNTGVAFNADGNTLASGGADGRVLLWKLAPSQILGDVNGDGFVNRLDLAIVDSMLGTRGHNRADVSGNSIVDIADLVLVTNAIEDTAAERNARVSGRTDVNNDRVVDTEDLVAVDKLLGTIGQSDADVNIDGIVNIVDLVLVANAIDIEAASAPSLHNRATALITTEQIQGWLTEARLSGDTSLAYQRGILVLEQLLAMLKPKTTVLLPNYPNPFNPETWIPYQLEKPADVTVTIYAPNGTLVRTLEVGHQPAGIYQSRARAAYWDGKNAYGEPVASSFYFYTLTAGEFTATRKMLIQK